MTEVIIISLGALAALAGLRLAWAWRNFHGPRLVTCPETTKAVGVALDASHAVWTALAHSPALRLESCSRWPERRDCGQECLRQIEQAPDGCLVRSMVSQWYAGKECALCGKRVGEIHWADHKPALLTPERTTIEWSQVAPESLSAVLETHAAVCWNCHVMQIFCREHPELVVNRYRSV
jgi:hypothetical protein